MFLNPEEILKKLNLRENMVAADFGCGSGGFTIPLAEKLENGIVFALDIQEEPLNALKNRASGLSNIRTVRCNLETPGSSKIQDSFVDFIFIINTLFQAEKIESIIEEAKRILKPGGKLLIIDWKEETSQGPNEKLSFDKLEKILKENKFEKEEEIDGGNYHRGVLMKKP